MKGKAQGWKALGLVVVGLGLGGMAQAAPVSGQGTWETTLEGRDLDGNSGTIEAYYDTVLGITWLANPIAGAGSSYDDGASNDGRMSWENAVAWAASVSFTVGGNTYDDWGLPTLSPVNGPSFNTTFSFNGSTDYGYNISAPGSAYPYTTVSELAHMFYVTLGNKAEYSTSGTKQSGYGLSNTGPFSNLQSAYYWSDTVFNSEFRRAFSFNTVNGAQDHNTFMGTTYVAWAVHPGDVGAPAVPLPAALPLFGSALAGLGLVGWRRKKLAA